MSSTNKTSSSITSASNAAGSMRNDMVMQLVAGAVAGSVTKTSIAPLERTKILFQLQGMKRKHGDIIKYKGILNTMRIVVREEGIRGLYKGNGANVIRIIPTYALKFSFNDTFKDIVRSNSTNKQQPLSFTQLMGSGTLAGLFQITVTYPLEVIRTRLSLSEGLAIGQGIKYNGIIDCATSTVRGEGILALYKGIAASWVSGAPYVGLQMTFYDVLKSNKPIIMENNTTLWSLSCGAISGLVAQTITFPGDTLRRRMQTDGIGGKPKIYSSTTDCARQILKHEGMIGFYRGLMTNVVRCIPGAAIQFYVYDLVKDLLITKK